MGNSLKDRYDEHTPIEFIYDEYQCEIIDFLEDLKEKYKEYDFDLKKTLKQILKDINGK